MTKICSKCKEAKPATNEYYCKDKKGKDGLRSRCKVCKKALAKAYYANPAQKERIKSRQKVYYSTPKIKERIKEYKKAYCSTPEYKERNKENEKIYRSKPANKTKIQARNKLKHAVRDNKITKPLLCTICQQEKPLEGHHYSYDMPLDVIWLCKQCHVDLHNELKKEVMTYR